MGGTIALLVSQGHTVTLIDMTSGEPTPFGSPEVRSCEAAAAAEILGVQRVPLGLINREVLYGLESRHSLAAEYRRLRPDILFIPYPQDAHPDHLGDGLKETIDPRCRILYGYLSPVYLQSF